MPSPNSLRNLKPWQPGCSGNPGGRPKAALEVRALAQDHTAEALSTIVEIMRHGRSDAVRLVLDRGWGRPAQAITGPEGVPFQAAAVTHTLEQFRERILGLTEGIEGPGEPP